MVKYSLVVRISDKSDDGRQRFISGNAHKKADEYKNNKKATKVSCHIYTAEGTTPNELPFFAEEELLSKVAKKL